LLLVMTLVTVLQLPVRWSSTLQAVDEGARSATSMPLAIATYSGGQATPSGREGGKPDVGITPQRLDWIAEDCHDYSRFKHAAPELIDQFRTIIRGGGTSAGLSTTDNDTFADSRCFYHSRGRWSSPISTATLDAVAQRMFASVDRGCTLEQLRRSGHLIPVLSGSKATDRLAFLTHAECKLSRAALEPHSFLATLYALRRLRPKSEVGNGPVRVDIVGDSIHRGLFAACVALARGGWRKPLFDRQTHAHHRYVITPTEDLWFPDVSDYALPPNAMIDIRFHAVFNEVNGTFPVHPFLDPSQPPDLLVTGGLDHTDPPCLERPAKVKALQTYLEQLLRVLNNTASLPSLVVIKSAESGSTSKSRIGRPKKAFTGGHAKLRDVMFGSFQDEVDAVALRRPYDVEKNGRVQYLDDSHWLNHQVPPDEVEEASDACRRVAGREGDVRCSGVIDEDLRPSDGLHAACVLGPAIPTTVKHIGCEKCRCLGLGAKFVWQVIASQIVALGQRRHRWVTGRGA
jgi:hypothetical protein